MIDKATYDGIASRMEHDLRQDSCIDWHVDRYNERLGEACISEETAQEMSTTLDAHFEFTYEQMVIWLKVLINTRVLKIKLYVARALVEDALFNYIGVIRQLAADEIALKLTENSVV